MGRVHCIRHPTGFSIPCCLAYSRYAFMVQRPVRKVSFSELIFTTAISHFYLHQITARHGTARHGTARHGTARHGTPRHATPRHATPRHATPRHATPRHATPRHATPRHATPRHATPRIPAYCRFNFTSDCMC